VKGRVILKPFLVSGSMCWRGKSGRGSLLLGPHPFKTL
jgi:hypothetical protein